MRTSIIPRRSLLTLAGGAVASAMGACDPRTGVARSPAGSTRIRAVALDALAVFSVASVTERCEEVFPGRGGELAEIWRSRQFEYTWIRAVARQPYVDFWHITEEALVYAARARSLRLSPSARDELMGAFLALKPWPDSAAALQAMKSAGLRVALLSNFTPDMLRACVRGSGLDDKVDDLLSTDAAGAFKPDARAYELGPHALGMPREEIAFGAFGGWDAAGAKWFGYRTFWVNRLGLPVEGLGTTPDATVSTLNELAASLT